jgi:hypothetical protein
MPGKGIATKEWDDQCLFIALFHVGIMTHSAFNCGIKEPHRKKTIVY